MSFDDALLRICAQAVHQNLAQLCSSIDVVIGNDDGKDGAGVSQPLAERGDGIGGLANIALAGLSTQRIS